MNDNLKKGWIIVATRLEHYKCDICDEEYENLQDAVACESSHVLMDGNVDLEATYHKYKEYPSVVYVTFADGVKRPYWNYDYERC